MNCTAARTVGVERVLGIIIVESRPHCNACARNKDSDGDGCWWLVGQEIGRWEWTCAARRK